MAGGWTPGLPELKARIWPDVIRRLSEGDNPRLMAEEYGVSYRTLAHWIMLDEDADKARASYFARELHDAYENLTECTNGLDLAKAKERLHHMRHLAEVRAKRYFGKDAQIQINMLTADQAITRIKQLEQELGYSGNTIEHKPEPADQA